MDAAGHEVTLLLASAQAGDRVAEEQVFRLIYKELRRIAANHLHGEPAHHALQPTILVHEVYIRLKQHRGAWIDRGHFFSFASRVMRHFLVDEARSRQAVKRGGDVPPMPLDGLQVVAEERTADILLVDELLTRLAKIHERQVAVVEMTFFGGLSEDEIAHSLKISVRTVRRDWATARAWLHAELSKRAVPHD